MTVEKKKELIKALGDLLEAVIEVDATPPIQNDKDDSVELLTVKECTQVANGLSEHALRQLVNQNKIPCIRVGKSRRGKILIAKKDLLSYLKITA